MILILNEKTTHNEAQQLVDRLIGMGLRAVKEQKEGRIAIAIVQGLDHTIQIKHFEHLPFVEKIELFTNQFKLAGRDIHKDRLKIQIKSLEIGGDQLCLMAGPCSVESEEQIHRIAQSVAEAGAQVLRGGVFKPRTSPYDFQGVGDNGLDYLSAAAGKNNLVSITEVMDLAQFEKAAPKIDILQIGARNMQNFSLLKELGKVQNPILLKRGLSATYKEFLMAAEYILNAGNPNVILCERGIRTFENYTRNTLDLCAVPVLQELSYLPIIVDPSHGTGIRSMVAPMARAAVAVGADGVIIETHYDPDRSYSDAQQTISTEQFSKLAQLLKALKAVSL